jgi:hypothetical protein
MRTFNAGLAPAAAACSGLNPWARQLELRIRAGWFTRTGIRPRSSRTGTWPGPVGREALLRMRGDDVTECCQVNLTTNNYAK